MTRRRAQDYVIRPDRQPLGRRLLLLALAVTLLFVGFASGLAAKWFLAPQLRQLISPAVRPDGGNGGPQISPEQRLDVVWQVWTLLEKEYVDPLALDEERMFHGAAAGLVSALGDPHTVFVDPLPAAIIDEDMQGSFEGIGATVSMTDVGLVIVEPLANSPALAAGLKPGDLILEVDGELLKGKTTVQAISLTRGPRGTVVKLLIQREGVAEPFVVEVTRERVELPILESRTLDQGVAYLRLSEFNAVAQDQVHDGLEQLLESASRGLVLDLRDNPGGYVHVAVDIAGEFLPEGTLVLEQRVRDAEEPEEFRVSRTGVALHVPLVVLVNGSSASAAEIVAGAIRDAGRGVLVGEQTFGKGSVQHAHKLEDGSSLRVTVAKWYLPSGRNLDGEGLIPDIEVATTTEDIAAGKDPQLERAVAYLLGGG